MKKFLSNGFIPNNGFTYNLLIQLIVMTKTMRMMISKMKP